MLYYLKIFLILTTIFFQKQVYAVENGIYTGVWKIIYSHAASDNTKGDSGIFEFTIKDNKVIKLYTPDVPIGIYTDLDIFLILIKKLMN